MIESEGRAVIIEKLRDVALKDELLPAAAARAVECLIPFKFSTNDFTAARHHLGVGPDKGGKGRLPKSTSELCVWIESTKQWVCTQKFIRQVADLVATADGYRGDRTGAGGEARYSSSCGLSGWPIPTCPGE